MNQTIWRLAALVCLTCLALRAAAAPAPVMPAPPQLAAEGYLLIDATTGDALVEFNANQRLAPASLTKIMTSYVAASELERGTIKSDDEVSVSVSAWRAPGSRMFIREGTQVALMDLLRGVIIQSGNDASIALAEHIAGSEDTFADVMNQYARQLGMDNTNFVNATGLPDENHYTTANDLARLTVSLINRFPEHYNIYSERQFTYNNIKQPNRNALLWRDKSVDGVKTGHTRAAGYCLVASARRGDMRLVSVIMGASSEESRTSESQKLLTYGFRYYETAALYDANEPLGEFKVWGGLQDAIRLGPGEDIILTIPKGARERLSAEMATAPEIHAPVKKGQTLGEVTITLHDGDKVTRPLVALDAVAESGFIDQLADTVRLFFVKFTGGDPLDATR